MSAVVDKPIPPAPVTVDITIRDQHGEFIRFSPIWIDWLNYVTVKAGAVTSDISGINNLFGQGLVVRQGTGLWTVREVEGTANQLDVANGTGVSGNIVLSISATYAGQPSITTVGTITTGTWNGTPIAISYGGTGATNAPDALVNLGAEPAITAGTTAQFWRGDKAWTDTLVNTAGAMQLTLQAYGGTPSLVFNRYNGTVSVPTKVLSGDTIGVFGGSGYDGVGGSGVQARINLVAINDWTAADHGTQLQFETTAPGSTVMSEKWRIGGSGNFVPLSGYDIASTGQRIGTLYAADADVSSTATVGTLVTTTINGLAGSTSLNIGQQTVDGADTARTQLLSSTSASSNRGAYIQLHGNEHATQPGILRLGPGSLGRLDVLANATTTFDFRVQILAQGTALSWQASTVAAFQRSGSAGTQAQISVISGNTGNARVNFGDTDAEDVAFLGYNNSSEEFSWKVGGTVNVLRLTTAQLTLPSTMADGTNTTAAASTAYAVKAAPNSSYRNLHDRSGSHTAGQATGTYAIPFGDPCPVSATGTLYPCGVFYLDPADFPTVNSFTTKLRVRANVIVNDTAPGATFVVALHPVTHTGATGGAGLGLFTIGAAVAGSAATTITTPAADSTNSVVGSDFAIPAAGLYCLGFVQSTGAIAASSHLFISAVLQMRNT
jgi:hypothetical protein